MKILVWQVDFWGIHIENFLDPKTLNQNMFGKWSNMAHEENCFHEKKLYLVYRREVLDYNLGSILRSSVKE